MQKRYCTALYVEVYAFRRTHEGSKNEEPFIAFTPTGPSKDIQHYRSHQVVLLPLLLLLVSPIVPRGRAWEKIGKNETCGAAGKQQPNITPNG
mmetsp:Transcript_4556/g.12735  ORF Transcript_4556/g.12735 Transcript_4556/m.12735 type:complete len:93 (-) Transcript_4556:219-497(-)